MTTPSPESLQEEAELALEEKAWTPEDFRNFVHSLNVAARKIPNPQKLIHNIYPDGNYGRATLEINLPKTQNEDLTLTLKTDATVIDGDAVGLGGEVSFTLNHEGLQALATFCSKAVVRLEDLPEE